MLVFISYETTTGLSYATHVRGGLKRVGISAFVADRDIDKGEKQQIIIDAAIRRCKYFVVIITLAATYSEEVKRELEMSRRLHKTIIPCKSSTLDRLQTFALPFVGNLQQIDFEEREDLADKVVTEIWTREQRASQLVSH